MTDSSKQAVDSIAPRESRVMGFWQCWGMSVGVMVGSGIFLLPTVLAPFGSISLLGWVATSIGAILLALILGRLAQKTRRSGGPYVYAQEAFGDLTGFLIAWGYWLSIVFAMAAVSVAFAGYLGALIPALGSSNVVQALVAGAGIWVLTGINLRSISEAAVVQLALTVLKLIPLLVIIGLAFTSGSYANIPEFNPENRSVVSALATTALLTMWAFAGVEAAVIPAGNVVNPRRTIPRAVISAALTVAALYILVTLSIMMLVPVEKLVVSQAPFVDAAQKLGPWGSGFIALGVVIATAGGLNGNIFLSAQMPMAVAMDGLAPKRFTKLNKGNVPSFSLLLSSFIATCLLLLNFSDGLVGAFTFLISMSTLAVLTVYAISALAELRSSWRSAHGWVFVALLSFAYTILAAAGSGLVVLAYGLILFIIGIVFFYAFKRLKPVTLKQ
ncbi:MAG: APA family basic amino acid/polyamine antiporter [Arenicella sp.]|jgi:APA family basic amino acid/polyamine antiporter